MKENIKFISEVIVIPVVIAIVGAVGTIQITEQQIKSSERIAQAQKDSAETIANAQIQSAREIADSQLLSIDRRAENDLEIRVFELFKQPVSSGISRAEREAALRLLGVLDKSLAVKMIYAVASNPSQSEKDRSLAFNIGLEIAPVETTVKMLSAWNIAIPEDKSASFDVRVFGDGDSGYPVLTEALFKTLSGRRLKLKAVPINMIYDAMQTVEGNTPEPALIEKSVLNAWNQVNRQDVKTFQKILKY